MPEYHVTWESGLVRVYTVVEETLDEFIRSHFGGNDPKAFGATIERVELPPAAEQQITQEEHGHV